MLFNTQPGEVVIFTYDHSMTKTLLSLGMDPTATCRWVCFFVEIGALEMLSGKSVLVDHCISPVHGSARLRRDWVIKEQPRIRVTVRWTHDISTFLAEHKGHCEVDM